MQVPYIIVHVRLLIPILVLLGSCHRDVPRLLETSGNAFGTTYNIQVVARASEIQELTLSIQSILSDVDQKMSTYLNDSEISQFNQLRDDRWFEVSTETFYVVENALTVARQTGGAFDPTSGGLVKLWGFGSEPYATPSTGEIAPIREGVGYQKLELRRSPLAIRKTSPNLELDLSGIAKGYSVDRLATLLESQHVQAFLIEIGGEIRANGKKPDGTHWKIAIQDPTRPERAITTLNLDRGGLATSGDYRNYLLINGKRYPHILDPSTGTTIDHNLSSVTVAHESAMYADAFATALMVMGPNLAEGWAEKHQLAAFFVLVKDSETQTFYTSQMEPFFE